MSYHLFRRVQSVYPPPSGTAPSVEAYVQQLADSGGAIVLRDTVAKVSDFDTFGNVKAEDLSTTGVDLTLQVARTFTNDTDRWVLGQHIERVTFDAALGVLTQRVDPKKCSGAGTRRERQCLCILWPGAARLVREGPDTSSPTPRASSARDVFFAHASRRRCAHRRPAADPFDPSPEP